MLCDKHPEAEAIGACTTCGKAVCEVCAVDVGGQIQCRDCLAKGAVQTPVTAAAESQFVPPVTAAAESQFVPPVTAAAEPQYQAPRLDQPQFGVQAKDPNTAFLIELVAGFFGFLGLGYIYVGRTQEGITRLIIWWAYLLLSVCLWSIVFVTIIGLICIPVPLIIQVVVPLWSANSLKKSMGVAGLF
jgi:TM2 domain-containing membrane protein YozV